MLALAVHWGDVASCADDERKVANGSLAMLAAMGLFRVPSECLTVGSFCARCPQKDCAHAIDIGILQNDANLVACQESPTLGRTRGVGVHGHDIYAD
jgi:hypothetical protein